MEENKSVPIKNVRVGNITISIWENIKKDGTETFKSCTIQKSFKNKEGKWVNCNNFLKSDLSSIAFATQKVFNEFEDE